jgi:transcriptional regulator with XRE-family HTH domain
MRVARRLREVRNAKGLSQAAIEKRVGLAHTYVSRLENGHITPTLPVLERLAKGLEIEVYQLFLVEGAKPEALKLPGPIPATGQERSLLQVFRKLSPSDRSLVLSMARQMVRRGNAGEERKPDHAGQARRTGSDHPTAGIIRAIGPDSDTTSSVTPTSDQRIWAAKPQSANNGPGAGA